MGDISPTGGDILFLKGGGGQGGFKLKNYNLFPYKN